MSGSVSINNRGYWPWMPIATVQPPSMTATEQEKDNEYYHSAWTRYFLSQQRTEWINYYRSNYEDNVRYAIDAQWGEESDVKMFLGDGASQTTRIPFKMPIMSPMLTRLVGGVDNISISAKAESATPSAVKSRKEEAYMEAMLMSEAARAGEYMEEAMEPMGIYPDEERTERFFDMTYQDHMIRGANSLMSMMAQYCGLDETKRAAAMNMALSGVAAFHCYETGNRVWNELIEPREFGWDTSSFKPDFTDGRFMYTCPLMSVPDIAERWNPAEPIIKALDLWARLLPGGYNYQAGWPQSRPRVFTMYWKDMVVVERGFVIVDGEPQYVTINQNDPDTGKPKYTDKDLVEPPVNSFTLAWSKAELKAKKQRKSYAQTRYCSMIPWEYLPGGYTKGLTFNKTIHPPVPPPNTGLPNIGVAGDIVLDYGVCEYQEQDPENEFSVNLPIKAGSWRYIAGHAVAPLTAARDPQRWVNQITSDVAYRMRVAGGKLNLIAKEALADSDFDEDELQAKAKEGGFATIGASQLGGIQNAHGIMDSSPGPEVYNMMGMLPQMKQVAESAVGVYEANYGAPQGQDQLVGTLRIQLQQAGVMQQPYYAALADVYKKIHQYNVQVGKQFYARRPWMLKDMVGDEDASALELTKDQPIDQFRVKISLAPDSAQLRVLTDQQIIPAMMQMGMLDPTTAAQLMGQSIPDDVYAAARQYTKRAAEAQQQMAEQKQKDQQAQAIAMEQASIDEQSAKLNEREQQQELEMAKIQAKLQMPYASNDAKSLDPANNPDLGIGLTA